MKIKFEIYSTVLDEVEKVCDEVNKNMKNFGVEENILFGFRVGEVTVEIPETETKESIKLKLQKVIGNKINGKRIWLKEVDYVSKNE